MKKIIYTLLLGLVFVSCQNDDLDIVEIQQIEIEEAKISNVSLEDRWQSFVDHVTGIKIPEGTTLDASASKGGDNGSNWIEIVYFFGADGTTGYVYLRPDDLGNGCYDNIATGVSSSQIETFTLKTVDGVLNLDIQEGNSDATFIAPVPAGTSFSFNLFFGNSTSSILFAENSAFLGWFPTGGDRPTATVTD